MLFEEFDKKVREAAEHHYPAYDEKAWTKMRKLLDKHMPQEDKDRRSFLFIILLFLLLGGGTWIYFAKTKPGTGKPVIAKSEPAVKKTDEEKRVNTIEANTITDNKEISTSVTETSQDKTTTVIDEPKIPAVNTNIPGQLIGKRDRKDQKIVPAANLPGDKEILGNNPPADNNQKTTSLDNKTTNPDIAGNNDNSSKIPQAKATDDDMKPVTINNKPAIVQPEVKNIPGQNNDKIPSTAEKKKQKKSSAFFISASAGPDFSIVGVHNPGKVKLVGGFGLGYTYKERFTLRTGFYSARKIYSAEPYDYNAPAGFYSYYPNLEYIKADCKVNEIPVTVSYNFKATPKKSMFVSAGLSTYLMKRETYEYYYKYTAGGPTVSRERSIYNANKHYFSVVNLSAGYQRNISKSISVSAEPYLKVPIGGVGFGKVKLNSAGVLFSVAVKPFNKKK